jgi:hypothetical protein
MNNIRGDEFIHPFDESDSRYHSNGETLRQIALREFMCTLMSKPNSLRTPKELAEQAETYVTAYINQLNK